MSVNEDEGAENSNGRSDLRALRDAIGAALGSGCANPGGPIRRLAGR